MALKIHKIKPLFTGVITTMNKYEEDNRINGIIDGTRQKGTLKEYQKVVEVGPMVRDIKVGDMVMINPQRFAKVNHKHNPNSLAQDMQQDTTTITYSFDVVTIKDTDYLYLQDRDIMYVFEGEEVPEESNIFTLPKKTIIV